MGNPLFIFVLKTASGNFSFVLTMEHWQIILQSVL